MRSKLAYIGLTSVFITLLLGNIAACIDAKTNDPQIVSNPEKVINNLGNINIPPGEILTPSNEAESSSAGQGAAVPAGKVPKGRNVATETSGGVFGNAGERRYKVEAVGFKCIDETGYDFLGSDEVEVGIDYIRQGSHRYPSVYLGHYEDVDSGELRTFESNKRCILLIAGHGSNTNTGLDPAKGNWECSSTGVPGPISFDVWMQEIDSNDALTPRYNIGRKAISYTAEELAKATPLIGSLLQKTIDLGPCYDERGCVTSPGTPNDAHYTFTYKITRLPDHVPERQS